MSFIHHHHTHARRQFLKKSFLFMGSLAPASAATRRAVARKVPMEGIGDSSSARLLRLAHRNLTESRKRGTLLCLRRTPPTVRATKATKCGNGIRSPRPLTSSRAILTRRRPFKGIEQQRAVPISQDSCRLHRGQS